MAILYLYLVWATLVATIFVHLSYSEMRTLHFGSMPPPAPGERFNKRHWLELAMPKRGDRCLERGAKEIECQTFEASGYGYHYEFAPLSRSPDGQVFVNLSVRADNDAHISLVGQNNDLPDMYEILIGGWSDTRSLIRKSKQGHNYARVDNPDGWLDGQIYKHFWVGATPDTSQDPETMTISVGQGSDENPFIEYIDPSPLPVNYLGFSLWDSTGTYKFCGLDLKN